MAKRAEAIFSGFIEHSTDEVIHSCQRSASTFTKLYFALN